MKKKIMVLVAILLLSTVTAYGKNNCDQDTIIKNKLFSIKVPKEYNGEYLVKSSDNKITFYSKFLNDANYGGFIFEVSSHKDPSNHAILPGSKKIGELRDKKGILYDMVIQYPTGLTYDPSDKSIKPDLIKKLDNMGKLIIISGNNGSKYFENQGTQGKYLYNEVLKKYYTAMKEKWDLDKLEANNMNYVYRYDEYNKKDTMDRFGYAFYDLNNDGIDELFIGEIFENYDKGIIYDSYTMVDRKPVQVVKGHPRDKYFVCNKKYLCNIYSSGVSDSGMTAYTLVENSTKLYPQDCIKYDYYNKKTPFLYAYGQDFLTGNWKNIDQKTFDEKNKMFDDTIKFDYIPFRKFLDE